eukprot:GHVU01024271.1.p1 GENE.GHVU01024271.1~~GHVU01024271.1.p1  ORF type:complete len:251 (-),score=30.57 GHVU01024271.1:714-1466(-)
MAEPVCGFKVGDFGRIRNLKNAVELNGRLVLVREVLEGGKVRASLAHRQKPISIATGNIELETFDMDTPIHEICEFWPVEGGVTREDIKVNSIRSWPTDWTKERSFLLTEYGWKDPQIVGGVTEEGKPKPTFMMYYDADDCDSPVNEVAQCIGRLLPAFELSKVPQPIGGAYRGTCMLVYSPMKMNISGNMNMACGKEVDMTGVSGPAGQRFTLRQLREVLFFHTTDAAIKLYSSHDNPYHRVFGGMECM